MTSILDQARQVVTPDVVRVVSGVIDESSVATWTGLATAISATLSGAVATASTPGGADWVRTMISEGCYGAGTLEQVLRMLAGGKIPETFMTAGGYLLTGLFGSRQDDVGDAIAKSTHLSGAAASDILRIAAPIVMAVIGAEMTRRRLDGMGIMHLLAGQRAAIADATPPAVAAVVRLAA
jgi:hypothetical protein